MTSNCIHCLKPCKMLGKKECKDYTPIASRPETLRLEIKQAYRNGDYAKAKELSEELFRKENGV